jgi:DNA-directed RNA polymerase alpha subunit
MDPKLSNISEDGDVYKFTISGINVSLANAIRRTVLSDIPTLAIYTETYDDNQCIIQANNTRLHNEILKQRLSCIPIHMTELDILPGKYILDLDVQNETDVMIVVTTEDFRIRSKISNNYLTKDEVRRIFPPNPKTNSFIDFARLQPMIGESIPGEHIKLTAEFSVRTAKENSTFNVVSKCAYGNTLDTIRANKIWDELDDKLRSDQMTQDEIETQKLNFYLLDAHRHFITDSFDFVIQTIGVYSNKDIIKKACSVLYNKFTNLILAIDSDTIPIINSETTMEFGFDIILENEDYTIGKVLEYLLYEKYYMKEKVLTFCGFKKFHPHNSESVIRVAYVQNTDKRMVGQHLRIACVESVDIFKKIYDMF